MSGERWDEWAEKGERDLKDANAALRRIKAEADEIRLTVTSWRSKSPLHQVEGIEFLAKSVEARSASIPKALDKLGL